MNDTLGVVILAAGLSRRMGRQKLLLPLGGVPLLAHVLATAAQLQQRATITVIGDPQQELAALCRSRGIASIYNPQRAAGQSSSIKLALTQLPPTVTGILFLPGDQPFLSLDLLQGLARYFFAHKDLGAIVAPYCKGEYRSPVLFGAAWRQALASLTGDQGGRSLLRAYPHQVIPVPWAEEEVFRDADTWEEYQQLLDKNETGPEQP